MTEKPSGLHAAIEHPLNLPGRDTFLRAAKQVDDLQPQTQRQVAVLEDRADPHREGLFAAALVEAGAKGPASVWNCGAFKMGLAIGNSPIALI